MPFYRDKTRNNDFYVMVYYEGKSYKRRLYKNERITSKFIAHQCEVELEEELRARGNKKYMLYELYDEYLANRKSHLEETTMANYRKFKKNYLSLIENKDIYKLSIEDISRFNSLVINTKKSASYRRRMLHIMKDFLEYLHCVYEIKSTLQSVLSVIVKEDSPKEQLSDDKKWLTNDEFEMVINTLNSLDDVQFYYIVVFSVLYYTGLRIGELTALKKSDYVITEKGYGEFKIRRSYARITVEEYKDSKQTEKIMVTKDIIKGPKTRKSSRDVVLDSDTKVLLDNYIERFNITDDEQLFHYEKEYLCQQRLRRVLKKCVKDAHIDKPNISLHSLRHSHSSNLRKLDFDAFSISDRLGNTPEVTSNTYTHISKDEQEIIADRISNNRKIDN